VIDIGLNIDIYNSVISSPITFVNQWFSRYFAIISNL
tara:strand:+ start:1073 stop:1183 length:111 start_codon:yes stop_codon:yes gene_type:complete